MLLWYCLGSIVVCALGNLSTKQIQQLTQRINPDAIKHLSQKELNGIFLPLGRILADGVWINALNELLYLFR